MMAQNYFENEIEIFNLSKILGRRVYRKDGRATH